VAPDSMKRKRGADGRIQIHQDADWWLAFIGARQRRTHTHPVRVNTLGFVSREVRYSRLVNLVGKDAAEVLLFDLA
jgi:hypothetical protein